MSITFEQTSRELLAKNVTLRRDVEGFWLFHRGKQSEPFESLEEAYAAGLSIVAPPKAAKPMKRRGIRGSPDHFLKPKALRRRQLKRHNARWAGRGKMVITTTTDHFS